MAGYQLNFNQDYTSVSVLSNNGYRLFSITDCDKVDELFANENTGTIRILERLYNTSLLVLVTAQKPNCLKMLHFKMKKEICNCVYPSEILCVRMNRYRLVVCLAESIHIHDIRDMKILHSIDNIAPNELGLCTLSYNSQLAFPICTTSGELRIFNANKLRVGLTIKAHDTALSALSFSPDGALLATASERGTVIRVFCVKNGQRVQEFRRGVKRCVRIASLVFSVNGDFLCASSNTETVHIFKIDPKAVEAMEHKLATDPVTGTPSKGTSNSNASPSTNVSSTSDGTTASTALPVASMCDGWSVSYFSKAVSSYLVPTQIGDVLAQDRAFATAVLAQPGLKHKCALGRIRKEYRLLIACEDGFLYVYDFNVERGGQCKLIRAHDLRYALEDVVELNLTENMENISLSSSSPSTPTTNSSVDLSGGPSSSCSSHSSKSSPQPSKSSCSGGANVIIENAIPEPDNSYASVLKGKQTASVLTDSAKYRNLCDAIDTPTKPYDERQFPPVAIAAKE